MITTYNAAHPHAVRPKSSRPARENFGDLFAGSDHGYPEALDRPPISVCASLAITVLMLAGAIYVLAFYLR